MKFFLDTANLDEIKEIASWGVLDGVTTNPTLISKEGKVKVEDRLKEIANIVAGPISMEVISLDVDGMLKEGRKYAEWAENIVIKLPLTPDGLKAVEIFKGEGIDTNVTLCFSANQAILAAKAGATYVSPFIGRLDDQGTDGMNLISEITQIFQNYHFGTQVLVASIRHPRHVTDAALLGADVCTIPKAVFEKLVKHPMTDQGIEKFLNDWKKRK
ncbi:fructose-6-phosphate aldolase [Candidatus Peregrinibacteria bacterium]|jgi:transaldolase|nr:fructose-6-phosphate aldolase [Candidatus Peregrinibacteria bacterium]MBT4631964.1 fructose-6-phosphate aldolase [Candidatus Peregrinibacteria bacterium]MBT5516966.1 fructose-6-phosphate aldolase [Candidatus Peregrinibacteria bacterium]MBT5823647.1 fructose-6-phosphate aldolase [Candidatus Peregrinibacteria bacterium]